MEAHDTIGENHSTVPKLSQQVEKLGGSCDGHITIQSMEWVRDSCAISLGRDGRYTKSDGCMAVCGFQERFSSLACDCATLNVVARGWDRRGLCLSHVLNK